jgi:hypothetical protein
LIFNRHHHHHHHHHHYHHHPLCGNDRWQATVESELPNPRIHNFEGKIHWDAEDRDTPVEKVIK